jgi:phosphatidylglycerol---prolipoprotein diacylglyceryl transferase
MIPFLHLGPLTIPTFGLMVATALLLSAYVLQADFDRRREQVEKLPGYKAQKDEGFLVIGIAGLAGLLGARLYHLLESPHEFFADPWPQLFSRYGFAWFGGFLGGFIALVFLARRMKIPLLLFLDVCSPAACVGYAVGRIGCLLSGDGDYGKPTSWPSPWGTAFPRGVVPTTETCVQQGWPADCRVYPTPIYEFLIWMGITALLWRLGTRSLRAPRARGEIFCSYLIFTGVARFLIEFIRINPRSFFGLTNAQAASCVSVAVGLVLLWGLKANLAPEPAEEQGID